MKIVCRNYQRFCLFNQEYGACRNRNTFIALKYGFNNQLVTFIPFLKALSIFRL